VGKSEGRRPFGRPRRRRKKNMKIDPLGSEMGWVCMDWIDLAHDRDRWGAFVNAVMNLCVQKMWGIFLTS
jgi:hypothetical protein